MFVFFRTRLGKSLIGQKSSGRWVSAQLKTLGTPMGYPIGVPIWILQKKPNLSRLLTISLRLSIIKPINNQNYQKSLGFRVENIVKYEQQHKTKLVGRFFEHPLSIWKRSVIPKKILTAQ